MRTTLTIDAVVRQWLDESDVLPITKRSYRAKTALWFRYLSARGIDPRLPRRVHILGYKHELEAQGRSALTVDSYIAAVKLFYKYCEAAGYYENIAAGIRSSTRYKGHRKAALTPEQTAALLASIGERKVVDKRDKLIVSLMIFHALRACEVERLDISDFDLEDGVPVIRLQRKGRREKAEMLAITGNILDLFQDYIACRDFKERDPVFISHSPRDRGRRLKRTSISEIVKARLRAIGIDRKDITGHSLRHTCGSLMVSQGVDIETIRDIMGHTSTDTTRIYVQQAQQMKLIRHTPATCIEAALSAVKPPEG